MVAMLSAERDRLSECVDVDLVVEGTGTATTLSVVVAVVVGALLLVAAAVAVPPTRSPG